MFVLFPLNEYTLPWIASAITIICLLYAIYGCIGRIQRHETTWSEAIILVVGGGFLVLLGVGVALLLLT